LYSKPDVSPAFKNLVDQGVPSQAYHASLKKEIFIVKWIVSRLNNHSMGIDTTPWQQVIDYPAAVADFERHAKATGTNAKAPAKLLSWLEAQWRFGGKRPQGFLAPMSTQVEDPSNADLKRMLHTYLVEHADWTA